MSTRVRRVIRLVARSFQSVTTELIEFLHMLFSTIFKIQKKIFHGTSLDNAAYYKFIVTLPSSKQRTELTMNTMKKKMRVVNKTKLGRIRKI